MGCHIKIITHLLKKVENSLNGVEDNSIDKKVEPNISIDNIMQNVTKRDKILQKRSQENKNKRVKVNFIELNKEFKINILEEQKPRVLTKKKIEKKLEKVLILKVILSMLMLSIKIIIEKQI